MQIEPTPTNPFGWVIWMIIFAVSFAMGFLTSAPTSVETMPPAVVVTAVAPDAATSGIPHTIESVEVLQPEPGKVVLSVTGYHGGCDAPTDYAQMRADNYIYIYITQDLPADAVCPMIAVMYAAEVEIEGEVAPGTYTFVVNGFSVEAEIE